MLIKTLLNKTERFKSFVYVSVCFMLIADMEALAAHVIMPFSCFHPMPHSPHAKAGPHRRFWCASSYYLPGD